MATLKILVELDVDRALEDPLAIAEHIVGEYNDSRYSTALGLPEAVIVDAVWSQ